MLKKRDANHIGKPWSTLNIFRTCMMCTLPLMLIDILRYKSTFSIIGFISQRFHIYSNIVSPTELTLANLHSLQDRMICMP